MKTFKRELKTILFTLSASRWAVQVGVQDVIVEYTHLQDAARTPTQARRVSLQIFHASRAIDSLLAHIAQYECIRAGRMPPTHWTLGSALMDIQNHRVNGSRFNPVTKTEIDDITKSRNTYLHRANCFPTDRDIQQFLNKTIRAIQEATAFQP